MPACRRNRDRWALPFGLGAFLLMMLRPLAHGATAGDVALYALFLSGYVVIPGWLVYQLFRAPDDDWLLAVASYNSGEGNVLKAVRRNKARSQPADFWHLKLSRETSSYVPKLMALVEIVRDPAAHGLVLPEVLNEVLNQQGNVLCPLA